MKFPAKFTAVVASVSAAAILSACQAGSTLGQPSSNVSTAPKQAAYVVDGKWLPADEKARAVYYNEFRNGKFGAYSPDGKSTIAVGTYTQANDKVAIKYFSETRNKEVTGNCAFADPRTLNCTLDSGSTFQIIKA